MHERPRLTVDQGSAPATFLLIHGTFAPHAKWTKPGSNLFARVEAEFPSATIDAIPWSGRNRFADRLDASKTIKAIALDKLQRWSPVFLIGHSHGGSAIIYALNQSEALRQGLADALFMGTPFMALATRPGYRVLQRALIVLVMLTLFACGAWSAGYFTQTGSWTDTLWRDWLGMGLAGFVFALCLWGVVRLLRSRWFDRRWERVQREASEFDTTRAPNTPMLFLRTTGDEVAMVMAFLQLLCLMSNSISSVSAWAVNRGTIATALIWRHAWGKLLILGVSLSAVVAVCLSGIISRTFGIFVSNIWDVLNAFSHGWGWATSYWSWSGALEIAYRAGLLCIDVLLAGLGVAASLLVVGLLLAIIFSTLAFWASGRFDPFGALALEMAAEPTPRGERPFVHLPWDYRLKGRADALFGLRHSEPYSDPTALAAVRGWVRGQLPTPTSTLT